MAALEHNDHPEERETDASTLTTTENGVVSSSMSRKEKRKALKKMKRKEARRGIAVTKRETTRMSTVADEKKVANTVYLFLTHYFSDVFVHSLLCFYIPIDYNNLKPFPEPDQDYYDKITLKHTSPILQFPAEDYPRFMSCSLMGSYLYFLGGVYDMFYLKHKKRYPSDVYVFDVSSSTSKLQKHSRMRTGKPKASTFVADGKLFVIGSANLSCLHVNYNYKTIKLFEAYDPEIREWQLVKDPPVENPLDWCIPRIEGDSDFMSTRKVSLYCSLRDMFLGLEFNLDTYEWTKLKVVHPWAHLSSSLIIDHSIYEVWWLGFMRQCLENWTSSPMRNQVHELVKLSWHKGKGSSHDVDRIVFCHLGHRHFCYIKTNEYEDNNMDTFHMSISVLREIQEGETSTPEFLYFDKAAVDVHASYERDSMHVECFALYSENYSAQKALVEANTKTKEEDHKLVPQAVVRESEKGNTSPCTMVQLQQQLEMMSNEILKIKESLVGYPSPSTLVQVQHRLEMMNKDVLKIKEPLQKFETKMKMIALEMIELF